MSTEHEGAIKVIVDFQAKPGKRVELKSLLESVAANMIWGQICFLGSTRYEVLDNPNLLVEFSDRVSAEMLDAAVQKIMAVGAYASL